MLDKSTIEQVKQLILGYGDAQGGKLMNDPQLLLKVKYDLMRHDVRKLSQLELTTFFQKRIALYAREDYLIVPKVIMILSNRCSLACKNCSMLIPEFKVPWEIAVEDAVLYIDNFLRGTDEVLNFNLVGGEPFLYHGLPVIINHLLRYEKVKHISMFTNGTIMPSAQLLKALKHDKIDVVISDYGNIVQMAKLINILELNGVHASIRSDQTWINFGGTHSRGRNKDELKSTFEHCLFSGNCKALLCDRLFVCERAARLHMLNAKYNSDIDCKHLSPSLSNDEIKGMIKAIQNSRSAEACNHCDAGVIPPIYVPAGEQIGRTNVRSRFTIIERTKNN